MGDLPVPVFRKDRFPGDHRLVAELGDEGSSHAYLARLIGANAPPAPKRLYVVVRQSPFGHAVVVGRLDSQGLTSAYKGIGDELWHTIGSNSVEHLPPIPGMPDDEWEGEQVGDVWPHMRHDARRGVVVLHLVDEDTRRTDTYNMTIGTAHSMRDWLNARLPAVPATAPDAGG